MIWSIQIIINLMNNSRFSKLEQSLFSLNFPIHYFSHKIQLNRLKVKINVYFVKNLRMMMTIHSFFVNFVGIWHVHYAVIKKESFINLINLNLTNKIMEFVVKSVIENFYKIK
jgi:hypothetical protein